jgi:hypothetical protein
MGLAACVCFVCVCHCHENGSLSRESGNPCLLKNSLRLSLFTAFGCFIKTDAVWVCHSRVFNICSSLAACTRVFLSGGNPCLLNNSFYISFLKIIMLKNILILKMDSRFHGNDSGGYSHFHGNADIEKRLTKQTQCFIKQTLSGSVIPMFLIFVLP